MILVLCDDNVIRLFDSLEEVRRWVEPIDVQNEEYLFCDETGQRYRGLMLRPVGVIAEGAFELRADGQPDPQNAKDLVDRASGVAPNRWHKDLESLRRHLTSA